MVIIIKTTRRILSNSINYSSIYLNDYTQCFKKCSFLLLKFGFFHLFLFIGHKCFTTIEQWINLKHTDWSLYWCLKPVFLFVRINVIFFSLYKKKNFFLFYLNTYRIFCHKNKIFWFFFWRWVEDIIVIIVIKHYHRV